MGCSVRLCCFPGESQFDDCQCDFNAIFQLRPRGTCKRAAVAARHSGTLALALNTDRNADICGLNCNLCSCNIEALPSNCKCNAFSRIVGANSTGSGFVFGYTGLYY